MGGRTRSRKRWSTVSGLHPGPAAIHHEGTQKGIQLGLSTAGVRALLGASAAELRDELLELKDVAPDLGDLPERLDGLSPSEGVAVVARALTEALARNGEARPRTEVGRALAGLTRGERVADVADEVGYSRRRLGTLVKQETGLGPKEYQRVARFEASRAILGHQPLADVAARCGYADQSHLSRDWSELAGCPPSTWLREEFPFLQDHEGPSPAV